MGHALHGWGKANEDLLLHRGKVQMQYTPQVQADPRAVPPVEGRNEIQADTWEVGYRKVTEAILRTTNPVMARMRLFYEMPQTDDINQWIIDLTKQAERIDFVMYDRDQAILDGAWRHKILSQKMTLQQAIDVGRTNVHTIVKNKKIETVTHNGNGNGNDREEMLGKLETRNRGGGRRIKSSQGEQRCAAQRGKRILPQLRI